MPQLSYKSVVPTSVAQSNNVKRFVIYVIITKDAKFS